ncbi:TolC family protein [Aureisphaera sp. CAU 1614]|uniref:TolC family protein n=1 Tax=Halomarinibacterium sedimenti TaxID=2857106 RepID=A0A9X1FQ01_9FLAO|nr:TolC family protein [Halomarinibacterium sedimenti]MBW2938650.1 TolC family protein [Halomarinibacterium sedimenti]
MKKLGLFIILFSLGVSIQAQNKKWTLRECVEHALENNISVKQSELDKELAEIEKSDAFGNFLPSLNGSASNSWNTGLTQNITTGVLENQTSRNSSYSVTLGVNIFQGLRNHRVYQRAKLSQLASDYGLSKMKDDISLFVANSYLQVLTNKANLEVLQSQNKVTQEQIQRTMDLVDAGVLPRGDLLEIQATDATEKQNIAVNENAVKISLLSLAQLLLIEDYENFDIEDEGYEIIDDGITAKNISEIIASAKENRSEIKIAETNLELAVKDFQISKSTYMPTLNAFINYNTRESDRASGIETIIDPNDPVTLSDTPIGVVGSSGESVFGYEPNILGLRELDALPFTEQLYLNDGVSYGFQLNVPIFNGFSTRNGVKRSKVNIKRQEFLLEQARLDLESTVYQAYVDAKGAYKSFEAAQKALESQELAYQYAKDRYDVGLTNAFDFSQSKVRYDNTKIEANRAKYDYIFKLKVLELYFGIPAAELKF